MRNGLINHIKPRLNLLLVTITPSGYQMYIFLFPSLIIPHNETNTCPPQPLFEKVDDIISNPLYPLALHKPLITIECLFFPQYIHEDVVKYH